MDKPTAQQRALELVLHATANVLTPIQSSLDEWGPDQDPVDTDGLKEVVVLTRDALPRLWAMREAVKAALEGREAAQDWWARRADPQHLTEVERAELSPLPYGRKIRLLLTQRCRDRQRRRLLRV